MTFVRGFVFAASVLCAACTNTPQKSAGNTVGIFPLPAGTVVPKSEQPCKTLGYQCIDQPIHVSLIKSDGSRFDTTVQPPVMVVQLNFLTIFPGQTLYIEADLNGDKPANLKLVPSIFHPEKTLILKFSQESDTGESPHMAFSISNPFDNPMKYQADLTPLGAPDGYYHKTSTCPVFPKASAYEMWPEPLFQLVIANVHLVDPKSSEASICD